MPAQGQKTKQNERQEDIFGGDEYAYYLGSGTGFAGVSICQTHQIVYLKYAQFPIYKLYLNKAA